MHSCLSTYFRLMTGRFTLFRSKTMVTSCFSFSFLFFSSDDVYLQSFHPSPPYIYLYNFLFFFMTKQLIWLPNYLLQNASKITVASIFSLSTGIPSAQFTPWQRYSRQTIKTWNIQTWRQILILEFRTSQECKFAQNKVSNLCVPYALLFRSGVYLSYK